MLKKSLVVSAIGLFGMFATPVNAATIVYNGTGGPLPDLVDFSTTILVPDNFVVTDVNVTLNNFSHTYWSDLDIFLSRGITSVQLTDDNGGSQGFNGNFTFDDEAAQTVANLNNSGGSFRPLNPLSGFDGGSAAGNWTLRIRDDASRDSGNLGSWTLTLQGQAAGAVPEPATWAMMLLGFGFLGGALRASKRRQKVSVSFA